MDDMPKKASCSWWWNSHTSSCHSQWLQSTLSEVDQNIKVMLTLMQQEDGDSFAQRAETYYLKRPELVKRVENFHRLYRSLVEYCGQLCVRSSLSSNSLKHLENFHNVDRFIKDRNDNTKFESSESNPESVVEDPEPECYAKSVAELKSPTETMVVLNLGEIGKMNADLTERTHLMEDQPTLTMKSEGALKKNNDLAFDGEMVEDSELVHSFELSSEQMSRLVEDNLTHLNELMRRNDEKREANKELWSRLEKMTKENHMLLQQQDNLMDENGDLHLKLHKLRHEYRVPRSCSKCSKAINKLNTTPLSKLKALVLSTFRGGGSS